MNLHYHIVKHEFTLSYCKTRILHDHIVKHEFTLYCKTQIYILFIIMKTSKAYQAYILIYSF